MTECYSTFSDDGEGGHVAVPGGTRPPGGHGERLLGAGVGAGGGRDSHVNCCSRTRTAQVLPVLARQTGAQTQG